MRPSPRLTVCLALPCLCLAQTMIPSDMPSSMPSDVPSDAPSSIPTLRTVEAPSSLPTVMPSFGIPNDESAFFVCTIRSCTSYDDYSAIQEALDRDERRLCLCPQRYTGEVPLVVRSPATLGCASGSDESCVMQGPSILVMSDLQVLGNNRLVFRGGDTSRFVVGSQGTLSLAQTILEEYVLACGDVVKVVLSHGMALV